MGAVGSIGALEAHGFRRWGISQSLAACQIVWPRDADGLFQVPHHFAVDVQLQFFVQAFEEGVENLLFSGVGDVAYAVLELGNVGVWVLRLLFDGV